MKKRITRKIKLQKPCFENLFSKARIESYENTQQYLSNLALVERITPIIGGLEVCIRNKINTAMAKKYKNPWWIFDFIRQKDLDIDFIALFGAFERLETKKFYAIRDQIKKDKNCNKDHKDIIKLVATCFEKLLKGKFELVKLPEIKNKAVDILISRQSCGFWGKVLSENPDLHHLSHPHFLDFKLYNGKSFNNVYLNQAYNNQEIKDRIAFFLLKNLRNRAFHWENLLKTQNKNSRITAKIECDGKEVYFEIKPKLIERFLHDMLKAVDMDLIKVLEFYRHFRK